MPTGIAKNGSSYITYTYDENGQRIRKQGPGNTALYFGEGYEVRGSVGVVHLFAGTQRVVSIRSDGHEQWYLSDHLGSASIVTDENGAVQEKIDYFPYGTYRERSDYSSTFPPVNYTFTDQEDDDETGLYNYGARLYDPTLGRFLSADSIIPDPTDLQSYNRYSYCLNNPLIYVDPSGHFSLGSLVDSFITGVVAAAVFAAIVITEVGTWGGATPFVELMAQATAGQLLAAGAAAGAVGGGLGAALQGGNILQGMVMGAAIGGLTAGFAGSFSGLTARAVAGVAFAVAGAGAAYAQGGLDGLANFGAGLAGAYVGSMAMEYAASPGGSHGAAQSQEGKWPQGDVDASKVPGVNNAAVMAKMQDLLTAHMADDGVEQCIAVDRNLNPFSSEQYSIRVGDPSMSTAFRSECPGEYPWTEFTAHPHNWVVGPSLLDEQASHAFVIINPKGVILADPAVQRWNYITEFQDGRYRFY